MVVFDDTRQRMEKSLEILKTEMATVQTGRATPALIENIVCSVYQGTQKLRLIELGSITAPDPQTLVVQPWDGSVIGEIKQGILVANVGLTPVIDGGVIRISVPPLTTERRQEYIKLIRRKAEEARVAVRNVRRDKMVEIKKNFDNKLLSEDEEFKAEQDLQKITDEYINKIDETGRKKERELLQI